MPFCTCDAAPLAILAVAAPTPVAVLASGGSFALIRDTRDHAPVFGPTLADEWYELALSIGRTGSLLTAEEAHPDATERELVLASFDHAEGLDQGYRSYARSVGFEMGLAGVDPEMPVDMPGRFVLPFHCGHDQGTEERGERQREMADYFARLDLERQQDERDREDEALARETMGYFQAIQRTLV